MPSLGMPACAQAAVPRRKECPEKWSLMPAWTRRALSLLTTNARPKVARISVLLESVVCGGPLATRQVAGGERTAQAPSPVAAIVRAMPRRIGSGLNAGSEVGQIGHPARRMELY